MLLYILKCFFIFVIKKLNSAANGQASGTWSFRNIKFLIINTKTVMLLSGKIKQVQQKALVLKKMSAKIRIVFTVIFDQG